MELKNLKQKDAIIILLSIIMMGICVGTHFINTMYSEDIIDFKIKPFSYVVLCLNFLSTILFIIGVIWEKQNLLHYITTTFLMYFIISFSCFCCNFFFLVTSKVYRYYYDIKYIYYEEYLTKHPEIEGDEELKNSIQHKAAVKYHMLSLTHFFIIGLMVNIISPYSYT
ncbi:hypothetical protein BCR36DRAFT_42581 [Piromyces finnis]|uniref:Uncharacterized protein n=1 Tax=Piromyces finnis TaxID=1754191 RepID=A0A1Y1VB82_9FUNG|nr:hypothetical protein BCR36DRAFT_42581 [Piromyces finnis]|eukprot:ORX51507.1 hypothetical protein BCR36DRAFT_42581 [Piromyces finnis]